MRLFAVSAVVFKTIKRTLFWLDELKEMIILIIVLPHATLQTNFFFFSFQGIY